jgi:excisionase family DNA binding protein
MGYAQVSRATITRAAREGRLPVAGRNGRSLVFRRDDLDRWMTSSPAESPAPKPPVRSSSRETAPAQVDPAIVDRLAAIRRGGR